MMHILTGYKSATTEMELIPFPKAEDTTPSKAEATDPQQLQEPEEFIDEGGGKPVSLTLKNHADLLQALVDLKKGNVPVPAETFAELTENINYSIAQQNYAVRNSSSDETRSDKEIQQNIQEIINGTQKEFMGPFMTASQKMTDYYNDISNLRNLLSNNIKPDPDDKDNKGTLVINSRIYIGIANFLKKWGDSALYPTAGLGVSKDEAQDWCAKMGVGKVEDAGSGKYKVIIDKSPLEDILKVFDDYNDKSSSSVITGDNSSYLINYKISQTVYNNLMSSIDTFLQKEQGKMNKIVNQLDYYNKLISQLQERLTDFAKQAADVALNFLRV